MRLIKFLKRISKAAIDSERDMNERVFISLTLMSEFVALCALIRTPEVMRASLELPSIVVVRLV